MSKKRKAEAPAAAPAAPKGGRDQQQTRSRKAVARANRRARPRDDFYEAEDVDAPDAHDTQRFDVSLDEKNDDDHDEEFPLPYSLSRRLSLFFLSFLCSPYARAPPHHPPQPAQP